MNCHFYVTYRNKDGGGGGMPLQSFSAMKRYLESSEEIVVEKISLIIDLNHLFELPQEAAK